MKTIRYFLLFIVTAVLTVGLSPWPGLAQEEVVCESDVIVQEGDWLSTIAERAYGDSTLYGAIVEATNLKAQTDSSYATIDDPNVIVPGWKLCLPAQAGGEAMAPAAAADPAILSADELANATYSGIYTTPVKLVDGQYEGQPFVEGGVARPVVQYIDNTGVYGDLTGSGLNDAAVLLVENSGGSGVFNYVGAQLNQDGQAVDGGAVLLGDRTQVISMVIETGQIVVDIVTPGPDEPFCCGTLKLRKTLALQNGKLAEVSSQELGTVSLEDLMGTSWVLERLNFDQPVLTGTTITADFAGGQVTGSAGCNSYSAALTSDGGQNLTVGPVISTQMACEPAKLDQELAYLTALQQAAWWSYFPGQLAVSYQKDDGSQGTLFYDPAPTSAAAASQLEMLTASPWQWVSFTDPVQQFDVDQPENYTLTFQADGMLQIKADCNQVGASYSASESGALSIQPGPATMAACPSGSRGDEFVQNLGFAAAYFFQDGNLFIDMMADGGTLEFSPQAAAEMAAATTSYTYQCDAGKSFEAEFTDEGPNGSVNLTLDGQSLALPRVPSGSGAKYSDDQTTFWAKGDKGFIEINGQIVYQNCMAQPN